MTEAQALADEIKRLAAEMSREDVEAAMQPTYLNRYQLEAAKETGRALYAAIDRLAAMAQTPAGWVMVPVEPTQEMLFAVHNGPMRETWADGYSAMLSAAPKPKDTK